MEPETTAVPRKLSWEPVCVVLRPSSGLNVHVPERVALDGFVVMLHPPVRPRVMSLSQLKVTYRLLFDPPPPWLQPRFVRLMISPVSM
jgi:hypothetical protein